MTSTHLFVRPGSKLRTEVQWKGLPNRIDTLGVPRPGVNVLLGKIAVLILLPLLLGRLDPGPLCDGVDLMLPMEVGLLCDPGSCWLVLLCLHTE